MSIARPCPTIRGRRTVPPSISGTPHRRQKTPIIASSSTTRISHHSANSRPPATAYPLTAAITGFDNTILLGPIGPGPVRCTGLASGVPNALRSAPAQNVPLSPHSTATAAPSSLSNSSNASYNSAAAGPLTALRASGRFMITVVTGPPRSTRTPPLVTLPPSVRHRRAARPVPRRSSCRPAATRRLASRSGSSSSGSTGSVSRWRTMPAAARNRPGTSLAVAISSSSSRPMRTQPGRSHSRAASSAGSSSRACITRDPLEHLGRQLHVQVVGAQPYALAKFAEPLVLQSGSQRRAGTGVGADAGDHQRGPGAVPLAQPGIDGVVLAALTGQQPVGEPVAVFGADQVACADHPGQCHPHRRLPDVEICCEPDEFARGRPRRVRAEQHAQHDGTGRHPRRAPTCRLDPGCLPAVVAERFVALADRLPEAVLARIVRRTRDPRGCVGRCRRRSC